MEIGYVDRKVQEPSYTKETKKSSI